MEQTENFGFCRKPAKRLVQKAYDACCYGVVPKDAAIDIFDFQGIPPFNQDFQCQPPQMVKEFKAEIRKADVILIDSPRIQLLDSRRFEESD